MAPRKDSFLLLVILGNETKSLFNINGAGIMKRKAKENLTIAVSPRKGVGENKFCSV